MKPVDVSKTPQLPNRAAMNQLGKSGRSILDYAKMTPPSQTQMPPSPMSPSDMISNLRKGG